MLYILRLSNGDCVVTMAANEHSARLAAQKMSLDHSAEVVSIRCMESFGVALSPTEDGSLEVTQWDDATLDDILVSEYPRLNEAYHRANANRFVRPADTAVPSLDALRSWHEKNSEIIREGLQLERDQFTPQPSASAATPSNPPMKSKTARVRL